MLEKLKQRWGIRSTWSAIAILIVFSLAGLSIVPVRHFFFHLLRYDEHTPGWLKFVTWLAIVFPTYQFFLIVYGTLLGEFRFFWEKEKKMGRWLLRHLTPRSSSVPEGAP